MSTSIDDQELLQKYPDVSEQEHIRSKDMWAGSSTATSHDDYVCDGDSITYQSLIYPPALYKTFDELIVNVIDHYTKNPKLVNTMDIVYDGVFVITNNGPGIEVQRHPADNQWLPHRIFGMLFKGSNLKSTNSIVGGTHGVGAKLSNVFSEWFTIETVDARPKYKLKYVQKWTNGMMATSDPVITPAPGIPPYTKIAFAPDYYGAFKWGESPPPLDDIIATMTKVLKFRVMKAASYLGYLSSGKFTVTWNGTVVPIKSMKDLSSIMFSGIPSVSTDISVDTETDPYVTKYWWEVTIVKLPSTISLSHNNHISVVNGVSVRNGAHIKWITDQIVAVTKDAVAKELGGRNVKYNPSFITNTMFIYVNAQIPGVKWSGQRKDEALVSDKKFIESWILDTKTINNISLHATKQALSSVLIKAELKDSARSKNKLSVDVDKYTPAEYAGTRYADKCHLILAEGDSAISMVRCGVTTCYPGSTEPILGFKWYGILSLGGVIMNARKKTKSLNVDGVDHFILSDQLVNNKFIKSFVEVLGLKFTHRYDPKSPTFAKEWGSLRYRGGIVIMVDQDHAGEGFICSLILNFIQLYWPCLIERGFVKRLITPYLRAYPVSRSGRVFEFTSTLEYNAWKQTHDESKYDLKYIKGLGTHEPDDTRRMFRKFHEYLFTYTSDNKTKSRFDVYFGQSAAPRKEVLRVPLTEPDPSTILSQQTTKQILANDHLDFKMKEHMEADLVMKLWHSIDGLNESGRKIVFAVRKRFANNSDEVKVAQLAGYVAEHTEYHYGEQSLWSNIIGKAYTVTGGVQLPILIPLGMFGTRNKAVSLGDGTPPKIKIKDDSASPRYIYTTLNKKLANVLYPVVDDPLLTYQFFDGKQIEPKYYIPIIPPVCESTEIPSEGWKIKTWAREVTDVIRAVRTLIKYPQVKALPTLRPCTHNWTGEIRYIRGSPYSVGKYWYDEDANEIIITELPLRVWTLPYVAYIKYKKSALVADVIDHSSDVKVNIRVLLREDAFSKILTYADGMWCDGVEEYLELRDHMDSHLNMIAPEGGVVSFESSYESVVFHWFPYRRDLYASRITRLKVTIELQIKLLELIERYIDLRDVLSHPKITRSEATERLIKHSFPMLTPSIIEDPGFIPTNEIVSSAVNGPKSSYRYLFGLTDEDKFEESRDKRRSTITKLRGELDAIILDETSGPFPGANMWLRELDELESVIKEGRMTNWMFGKKKKLVYD